MANCILGSSWKKVLFLIGIKRKFLIVGVHINDTGFPVWQIFAALKMSQNVSHK